MTKAPGSKEPGAASVIVRPCVRDELALLAPAFHAFSGNRLTTKLVARGWPPVRKFMPTKPHASALYSADHKLIE